MVVIDDASDVVVGGVVLVVVGLVIGVVVGVVDGVVVGDVAGVVVGSNVVGFNVVVVGLKHSSKSGSFGPKVTSQFEADIFE